MPAATMASTTAIFNELSTGYLLPLMFVTGGIITMAHRHNTGQVKIGFNPLMTILPTMHGAVRPVNLMTSTVKIIGRTKLGGQNLVGMGIIHGNRRPEITIPLNRLFRFHLQQNLLK